MSCESDTNCVRRQPGGEQCVDVGLAGVARVHRDTIDMRKNAFAARAIERMRLAERNETALVMLVQHGVAQQGSRRAVRRLRAPVASGRRDARARRSHRHCPAGASPRRGAGAAAPQAGSRLRSPPACRSRRDFRHSCVVAFAGSARNLLTSLSSTYSSPAIPDCSIRACAARSPHNLPEEMRSQSRSQRGSRRC